MDSYEFANLEDGGAVDVVLPMWTALQDELYMNSGLIVAAEDVKC